MSGSLEGVVGIVLCSFEGFRDVDDRGWTIVDVLSERLGRVGVPILGGVDAGHDLEGADGGPDQTALPLGVHAELDAGAGTLTLEPLCHRCATRPGRAARFGAPLPTTRAPLPHTPPPPGRTAVRESM